MSKWHEGSTIHKNFLREASCWTSYLLILSKLDVYEESFQDSKTHRVNESQTTSVCVCVFRGRDKCVESENSERKFIWEPKKRDKTSIHMHICITQTHNII